MGDLIGLVAVSASFVMVCFIVWLVNQKKLEEKRIAANAGASSETTAQYAAQVQRLEDRVQVLERIITDRGYDLATQDQALREARAGEQSGSGVPITMNKQERV
jgi:hypothetical protein